MPMALAFTAGMLTACGETKDMETSEPAVEETEEAVEEAPEEEDAEETAEESEPETAETTEAAERKHISDYMPGTWDGVIYANEELGVKLTFPESYTIFSGDALKEMMGQTIDVITENSDIKNVNEQALAYDFLAIAPDQVGNVILTVEEMYRD